MPSLDLHVSVVEPMGDEVIVHGSVAAELANHPADDGESLLLNGDGAGGRAAVVARLAPRDRPAEGSVIRLGADPAAVHLFDAESGQAIR
jgi:ABC-type sugar transport system ATPase subunit